MCVCVCVCVWRVRVQLGDYISDIASNMMLVEEHVLWMAQNEARACTRIVQCVERIADHALNSDTRAISKVLAQTTLQAHQTLVICTTGQRLIVQFKSLEI